MASEISNESSVKKLTSGHNGHRNTKLTSLALYHRNDWHGMTEMGGTMATELSIYIPLSRPLATGKKKTTRLLVEIYVS